MENHFWSSIVKFISMVIITLLFTACTIKREVIMPDKSVYTVKAQKDDLVTFKLAKDGDIEMSVDGRGRPGMIEQALGIMFMSLPDVEIGTGD